MLSSRLRRQLGVVFLAIECVPPCHRDVFIDPQVMDLPLLKSKWRWVYTQLPVYRACFTAALCAYLWAACLYVWNRARINYQFMFDLDTKHCLSAIDAASLGTRIMIVTLLSFMLLNKNLLGELPPVLRPGLFPTCMMLLTIGSLVLPVYRGRMLFSCFGRVLMAPFFPVTLWDSFVADCLVRPRGLRICTAVWTQRTQGCLVGR